MYIIRTITLMVIVYSYTRQFVSVVVNLVRICSGAEPLVTHMARLQYMQYAMRESVGEIGREKSSE